MIATSLYRGAAGCILVAMTTSAHAVESEFFSNSSATLGLRNFYYHRDLQAGNHDLNEWAQAISLAYTSGFTEGQVGFGVDINGWVGLKLDSAGGSSGTGILPKGASGEAPDNYSRLGATVKMRYSKTDLRVGTHMPKIPLLAASDARLLPQTFNGATIESREIEGLLLTAGRFDRTTDRAQAGADKMTLSTFGPRNFGLGGENGDRFQYVGAEYKFSPDLLLRAYHGGLKGYYKQTFLGANYNHPLSAGQSLAFDLRYFQSSDDGHSRLQQVDNRTLGALMTYNVQGHAFSLGFQDVSGNTGFTYIAGTDAYVVNSVQWGNFSNTNERSWQAKYTYNFAVLGVPGLTFMTRYISGYDVQRTNGTQGKEWERNTDVNYVFQSGTLKNLSMTVRNASYRSNFNAELDEVRVIFNYPISIL